jgi:hypothetical protein
MHGRALWPLYVKCALAFAIDKHLLLSDLGEEGGDNN